MPQSTRFKALVVEENADSTFTKSICERDISELPDNELLVEVHYSSLNFKDAMILDWKYFLSSFSIKLARHL